MQNDERKYLNQCNSEVTSIPLISINTPDIQTKENQKKKLKMKEKNCLNEK